MMSGLVSSIRENPALLAFNDYRIDSYDVGLKLHLREKYLEGIAKFPGEKVKELRYGCCDLGR